MTYFMLTDLYVIKEEVKMTLSHWYYTLLIKTVTLRETIC